MPELVQMAHLVKNDGERKDAEERLYLVCLAGVEGVEDDWYLCTGRTEAYDTIKDCIESIDLSKSFIMVETATLKNRKSIYAFMKHVEQYYPEDTFDIDDYVKGDWSEEDYKELNGIEIDPLFNVNNSDKLNMEDFMNGEISTTSLRKEED